MNNASIKIRKISVSDLNQLQKIGRLTFEETFSASNNEEDMKQYLDEGFATEKLKTEVENPNSEFYFAEINDEVIGYLKLNFKAAQTELVDENAMEIERIYVLQRWQGHRVGQLLFDQAMTVANQNKVMFVWLGVWEKNPKAIRFYEKNGFEVFDQHVFKLGDDEQVDLLMKLYI